MKECYYSILGVERKADDDSIKKAYRQLALKHHPDKCPEDRRETATSRFQLIVEAYECLSNRQERAWYDDHREQILRGGDASSVGESGFSTKRDIWKYFSSSCFNGNYNDGDGGFYKTYAELFEELASLERESSDSDSDADQQSSSLPAFGDSKSEWEDVQSFYTQWSNFQSCRHFHGFDKWDVRDGENRQIRRAMEVENKKARSIARKEYSTAVRNLVDFVKRRDHRVIEFQSKQAERERFAKSEKERLAKEKEEQKRIARQTAREEEMKRWAEIERIRIESGEVSQGSSNESGDECSEDANQEFVCVACRKNFKTEKAYANHENSKKHKQEVDKLRQELLIEEAEVLKERLLESDHESHTEVKSKKDKKKKKKTVFTLDHDFQDPDDARIPSVKAPELDGFSEDDKKRKSRRRRAPQEFTHEPVPPKPTFQCKLCKESFPSKSALFRHLEATGHHALVSKR
jgi:DnaJ family protein A protein 5